MKNKLVMAAAVIAIVAAAVVITQAGLPVSKTAVAGTGFVYLDTMIIIILIIIQIYKY